MAGRPRLPNPRNRRIGARVSVAEYEQITQAAYVLDVQLADLVREAVLEAAAAVLHVGRADTPDDTTDDTPDDE